MRMHIELDDDLVKELDAFAGARGRSAFVRTAVAAAVQQARREASLVEAAGAISDSGHAWDDDPAAWVCEQRRADDRRAG